MKTFILRIVGSTPLLLHRVANHQFRDQIASKITSNKSFEEEALQQMCKDFHGNPSVQTYWIWNAIRKGCSHIIVGEGKQLSFVKLQQSIHMPTGLIQLRSDNGHQPEWEIYTSVQHSAPKSKKMITVVAPMFKRWILELPLVVEGNQYDDSLLQRIFKEAGKVGIGLFHPPKKHFGQFRTLILRQGDAPFAKVALPVVQLGMER